MERSAGRAGPIAYAGARAGGYYENAREDLVAALPRPLGRVLDVGCGAGAVGRLLRSQGATWVAGIELDEDAGARAREVLDEVAIGPVEAVLASLSGPWETICCYDVLEHLVDPHAVLRELREAAVPGARLHVSVPNARHLSLVYDLLVRGTFGYTDWGHRDATHLRWFTRRDLLALLEGSGWTPRSTSHPALGRSRVLAALTGDRSSELLVGQWYALAVKAQP